MVSKIDLLYQGYCLSTVNVVTWFQQKYNRKPAEIITTGGCILAGPIGKEEQARCQRL